MALKSDLLKNLINKFKKNDILTKGSSAFIFKIIGSFLGYLFLILVTNNLGAESWGIFALCMALLNIVSIFSRFGIDTALLRFVAQYQSKIEEVKGVYFQGISLVLIFSFFFSILLYFFSDIIAELVFRKIHLAPYFKIIAFALIPFSITHVNDQTFRGLKKIKKFAFFQYVSKFLFAIIFFLLLSNLNHFDQFSLPVYAFSFAVFMVMIVSLFNILKNFRGIKLKRMFANKEIIKTSFPMMLSSSVLLLMAWSDTVMIGIFKTEADVGVYNVALKLAMITGIVLGAINSIVAPNLSETFNNNRIDDFRKLIKQSTRIIFFCTLPILIILLLFPEFLLSFFGSEFMIAKTTLLILLLGQLVNSMSGSVGFILQMTGKQKIVQNVLFIALLINIFLNFILIPKYGYEGASIASSSSIIFWNLTLVLYVKKYYNINSFIS